MTQHSLSIGQVAKQTEVGIETIRFYERQGLIEEPPRRASGYRQYPEEVVIRIRFIKNAKALGFSLKEITELLELRLESATTAGDIKRKAQNKVADIENKIKSLQTMKQSLDQLIHDCKGGRQSVEACPILKAMDGVG